MKWFWRLVFALIVVTAAAFPWLASMVYGAMRIFETPSDAPGTPSLMSLVLCFAALAFSGFAVSFKAFGNREG